MEIRDKNLYRVEHTTFEGYCKDKWNLARSTAYQMIDGAKVAANVRQGGHSGPTTERQARPLTKLPPEQQPAAWAAAVEKAES